MDVATAPNRAQSGPRVLLDTNIWSYLVALDAVEEVNRIARDGPGVVIACPAVLYEMFQCEDAELRRKLVKAICRTRWRRLMPEIFDETSELKSEITRLHPQWLRDPPDRLSYLQLYNDWHGNGGVWLRARTNPDRAAAVLAEVQEDRPQRAREDAYRLRSDYGKITNFDTVTLTKWTSTFLGSAPGWDGEPVETWRAETLSFLVDALLNPRTGQSAAPHEWLSPWLDIPQIRCDIVAFGRLILYETTIGQMPRSWLRWAFRTLQATRTTNDGTPVDNQIGVYLLDVDYLVTADKTFASITDRIRKEKAVDIATPVLVKSDNCLDALADLLS